MRRLILWLSLSLAAISTMAVLLVAAQEESDLVDFLPITEDVRYEAGPGDTLDTIAATFDVNLACLRETNELGGDYRLIAGDILIIRVACPAYSGLNTVAFPRPGASEQGGGEGTYLVQYGDTLSSIAAEFNVALNSLQQFNNLETTAIFAGQVLDIPPDAPPFGQFGANNPAALGQGGGEGDIIYIVQPGDTLDVIAFAFDKNTDCIAESNALENPGFIQAGDSLLVPDSCGQYVPPNIVGGRILPFEDEPTPTAASLVTATPRPAATATATLPPPDAPQQTAAPTLPPATPTQETLDLGSGGGNEAADEQPTDATGNLLDTLQSLSDMATGE